MKILKSLFLSTFIFSFLGWLYVVICSFIFPESMPWKFCHLTPWMRTDTFGIICFVISFISFFLWQVFKSKDVR